jgi:hypothetical protein
MRELRKTVGRMEPSQNQNGEDGLNLPPTRPRRRWERHDITIPVTVTTMVSGKRSSFSGQACDMSIGGLRLFLTREIEPGTSLQLEFPLPYHSLDLAIRGVVRNRTGFTHGVEFVNPTREQQVMIDRTCSVLGLLR